MYWLHGVWRKVWVLAILLLGVTLIDPTIGCAREEPTSEENSTPSPTTHTLSSPGTGPTPQDVGVEEDHHTYLPLLTTPTPAFPGAEGFGAMAVGGRGGRVIPVTTLNDGGPGSLRACIDAEGRRTCVFRVAGEIVLNSPLEIKNSYVTIAGQTAPGGGITLRSPEGQGDTLLKVTGRGVHDVIVRYLRLRMGKQANSNGVNLIINYGDNVIVDHVSFEWSNAHHIVMNPAPNGDPIRNVTVQRSILAQALAPHNTAVQIRRYGGSPEVGAISLHNNLFAHNSHRSPRIRSAKQIEVVNNVVYNWILKAGETVQNTQTDFVGNYMLAGPWSRPQYVWEHEAPDDIQPQGPPSLYLSGNVARPAYAGADDWDLIRLQSDGTPIPPDWRRSTRIQQPAAPVTVRSAEAAYDSVLADVGANARVDCAGNWVPTLDAIDRTVVDSVVDQTAPTDEENADHQNDFGGYPAIDPGTPCADGDRDGMPDAWEELQGLNATDPSDGPANADADGYTNLEEYLNGTDPRRAD